MGLAKTLLQILLMSFALAVWEILLQPFYITWLEAAGRSYGVAEAFLGYVIVLSISYFISRLVSRRWETE